MNPRPDPTPASRPHAEPHAGDDSGFGRPILIIFLLGWALHLWLLSRSWVDLDQLYLLDLGQEFARTGTLAPMAKVMSGGGMIPGSLLQLLSGLPLMLWQDYRAPLVPIAILNLLPAPILLATLRGRVRGEVLLGLFAIYWLSPWRLIFGAILWEPAYIFALAAAHLWACTRLSEARRGWPSFVLGALLVWAPQIHGSFLFLWALTALLLVRRRISPHGPALAFGASVAGLTLVPLLLAALAGTLPSSLPRDGFIGRGLVYVLPVLKVVPYWLRLPTLDIGTPLRQVIYLHGDHGAATMISRATQILSTLTILLPATAYWSYFRRWRAGTAPAGRYSWFERYAGYSLVALALAAALSPVTLQGWHVTIALLPASIPLACWIGERMAGRAHRGAMIGYLLLGVVVVIVIGLGKPAFRKETLPSELDRFPAVAPLLPPNLPVEPVPRDSS